MVKGKQNKLKYWEEADKLNVLLNTTRKKKSVPIRGTDGLGSLCRLWLYRVYDSVRTIQKYGSLIQELYHISWFQTFKHDLLSKV